MTQPKVTREEIEDGRRLDFMIQYGARIAHARDDENCNVWVPSDEDGEYDRPIEGYPQKRYDTAREAIDAAMRFAKFPTDPEGEQQGKEDTVQKPSPTPDTGKDYEAMKAARQMTTDDLRWLGKLADRFKEPSPTKPDEILSGEEGISPSEPFVILAGIKQFGLAADGADLRDLHAAISKLRDDRDHLLKVSEDYKNLEQLAIRERNEAQAEVSRLREDNKRLQSEDGRRKVLYTQVAVRSNRESRLLEKLVSWLGPDTPEPLLNELKAALNPPTQGEG